MSSFLVRLRSSIILMAITILCMVLGGDLLFAAVIAISLIGMFELFRVLHFEKSPLAAVAYAACLVYYGMIHVRHPMPREYDFMMLVMVLIFLLIVYVLAFPKYQSEQVTMAFFGLIYVAVMLSFIYLVREATAGRYMVWLIFVGSWGADTCAYCVGVLIGKHKIPGRLHDLSPKKTIEGCLGGIIGAALIGLIFGMIFRHDLFLFRNPALACMLIGGCSAILSEIGDLAASAIKRNHGIKDYGTLIPGHGGIMDRFDSVIFTSPVVYILVQILKMEIKK